MGSRPPNPLLNGVWGGSPTGSGGGSHSGSLGAEPPATFLRRTRPGGWGGAPNDSMIWLGGRRSCGFAALSPGPFGLATRALRAHPPNWIQTNLAPRGETKPVGLIVPSWGSAPNPGAASPQERCWGLPPPDPLLNGVWGGAPTGSGAEPPATFLRRSRPWVFWGEPQLIQSSQPVWSRREEPNLSESSLAFGL